MSKVLNKMIDLVFDKHCRIEEVSYQQDEYVCHNLIQLKKDILEVIMLYLSEVEENTN